MKQFQIVVLFFLLFSFIGKSEATDRKLLSKEYLIDDIQNALSDVDTWHPFPKYGEPGGWDQFPEDVRKTHIALGDSLLGKPWTFLPASVFLEFYRNGNRSNFQKLTFARRGQLAKLVFAEMFEQKQRFIDDIVNGIWAICEETYWGIPAHLDIQTAGYGLPDVEEPTVDLFVSETATLLAWTYYLLGSELEKVSPLVTRRIEYEMNRRVLTPCFNRPDFWWMGFNGDVINNWNPWVNSSWLTCILLFEKDPNRRSQAVYRVLQSLDKFIEFYPDDGGCDEGPGYWKRAGGSLFDCLELLALSSNNKINFFSEPLVANIGAFIYKTHIDKNYFTNFADATPKVAVEPAHVYRFGKCIHDSTMMKFAAYCGQEQSEGKGYRPRDYIHFNRHLSALFTMQELSQIQPEEPFLKDMWLPDIQLMTARSRAHSGDGFFMAAKGGHNAENHNHNDVGSFIIYYDGDPLFIDVGAEVYTRKTFNNQRYTLWFTQSGNHNVPVLNGEMQKDGRMYAAKDIHYYADDKEAWLQSDIAGAYPEQARIKSWIRKITLVRNQEIRLEERYEFDDIDKPVILTFMTLNKPQKMSDGKISIVAKENQNDGKDFYLNYDKNVFDVKIEPENLTDVKMLHSWGKIVYKIQLVAKDMQKAGKYIVTIDR